MNKINKVFYLMGTVFFFYCSEQGWSVSSPKLAIVDPFFCYTAEERQSIRALPLPKETLTQEKIAAWNESLYLTTANQSKPNGEAFRVMAYLYVAQRDFALLSKELSHEWLGNPDGLIVDVITLFYPHFRSPKPLDIDPYSAKISQIIFEKIKDRFHREQKRMKDYPKKTGLFYWKEEPPIFGQRIGRCYPWLLNSSTGFQAPSPPGPESIIWVYGLDQIRFNQAHLNKEQKKLIYYWAGELGPESGNWFVILNHALASKNLDLSKFLWIRAVFSMGYSDAMTAVFDSKYTYWVRRPHMMDSEIHELIRCPKHPSYPSGHSTTSSAAAVILSYFFSEEAEKWRQLAIEAGNSRVWAGIHYPIDNEQGLLQGEKVGNAILERLAQENTSENQEKKNEN